MKVTVHKLSKSCNNCIYYNTNTPHTCDICTSLGSVNYKMWKYKKSNSNKIEEKPENETMVKSSKEI